MVRRQVMSGTIRIDHASARAFRALSGNEPQDGSMDAKTEKGMRAFLEAEQSRLQSEVNEIQREGHEALSEASGENNYRDHMADQGTATFARELDMSLDENVREALSAVGAALMRIDDGSYGTCERCGANINEERLKAMPTATLCITCKAAEESL